MKDRVGKGNIIQIFLATVRGGGQLFPELQPLPHSINVKSILRLTSNPQAAAVNSSDFQQKKEGRVSHRRGGGEGGGARRNNNLLVTVTVSRVRLLWQEWQFE